MVLDEDALEAMLKRQKREAEDGDSKETKQTELTHQTEEFEVYEKEPGTPKTGAGLRAADSEETESAPGIRPEVAPALEPEPEPEPPATPEPEPQPEKEAPTTADEVLPEAFHDAPEPETTEEPAGTPDAETDDDTPERPRVWPPLSGSKEAAPGTVEPEPVEPQPEPEPEPPATPEPTPEPTPAPTPEPEAHQTGLQEAAEESASAPDSPHSHAHADLDVDGGGVRIAIVQALFNQEITDMMADLAVAKAKKRGAKVTHHVTVPGVYDLPLVTAHLLEQDDVDCAVVIGAVVQGETSHDDLITHATARTLQQLSLDVDKPIGFGVTGPGMTWKQAEARVANGAHAVDAALAQVEAIKTL